jgi:hypothetical protein
VRLTFEQWRVQVDGEVGRRVGLSVDDLEDVALADWYEDGMSAKVAARKAIAHSGGAFW